MKTGVELIAEERKRQIEVEGWTKEHDAEHDQGEMALAAACYAAPIRIYKHTDAFVNSISFDEPWPWEDKWDKRYAYGKDSGNRLPDPKTFTVKQRIDLLIKAGALIAAEIDNLHHLQNKKDG